MVSRAITYIGSAFVLKDTRFKTTIILLVYFINNNTFCFMINNLPNVIYLLLIVLNSIE